MDEKQLYEKVLGLEKPWRVEQVAMEPVEGPALFEVVVRVGCPQGQRFACAHCERELGVYDRRARRWRHLDTCQYRTILEAEVPRVECPEHGVVQVRVPWAEAKSRFTALLEGHVIWFLKLTPCLRKAQEWFGLSWDEVDGIVKRAVERGQARRQAEPVHSLGLDETSFQKGHDYVTVISDRDRNVVLAVLEDRTQATLEAFYAGLPPGHLEQVESVSQDMWGPYIAANRARVPDADRKICFDRFHVAGHLGRGVDLVRRREHRELSAEGWAELLAGTKHQWLRNSAETDNRSRRWFMEITRCALKTARAWALKETASQLWDYVSEGWARRQWTRLIRRLLACGLEPMVKVGRMIRLHLQGILNAIRLRVNNAKAEGLNACIQRIKGIACGYRNKQRFIRMILFVKGGLDLYPAGMPIPAAAHTNS
jgi:transposase